MGNKGKSWFACALSIGALVLFGGRCDASENVIYIVNNNAPNYSYGGNSGGNYGGGVVCTEHGGICATGRYMLSTGRVRYVAPQWKRQTIRERKLSEAQERQAYYR